MRPDLAQSLSPAQDGRTSVAWQGEAGFHVTQADHGLLILLPPFPKCLIRASGKEFRCHSQDPEEIPIVLDTPGQGPRKEAWRGHGSAYGFTLVGCFHSAGSKLNGGAICMVAHPGQVSRDQRSWTAGREYRARGETEACNGIT